MMMVTANIDNSEWMDFARWCRKLKVKYTVVYDYKDAVLVKVPIWFFLQWVQGELDEGAADLVALTGGNS